jgi:hypothetical protein
MTRKAARRASERSEEEEQAEVTRVEERRRKLWSGTGPKGMWKTKHVNAKDSEAKRNNVKEAEEEGEKKRNVRDSGRCKAERNAAA